VECVAVFLGQELVDKIDEDLFPPVRGGISVLRLWRCVERGKVRPYGVIDSTVEFPAQENPVQTVIKDEGIALLLKIPHYLIAPTLISTIITDGLWRVQSLLFSTAKS